MRTVRHARPVRGLQQVLLLVVMVSLGVTATAEIRLPVPPGADGESCVEPVEVMRRDHMDLLMHQRDRTVRDGIRTSKHSLVNCLSCHTRKDASGAYIPVNAAGEFCQVCHGSAGVRMDCFECHATRPDAHALRRVIK